MKVGLQGYLNDGNIDATQSSNQRQLAISVSAVPTATNNNLPLNLCLILDHSGSMEGRPLETVKKAAQNLVERLKPGDRISVIAFDHRATIIVPNQEIIEPTSIQREISKLKSQGGTAIDEGMRVGIEEIAKGKNNTVSQIFLLTDGENEHGDNNKCLKLAQVGVDSKFTINTLGFGDHWNQDILEKIADIGAGALSYIENPDQVLTEFNRLFTRIQSVGLTNAYLQFGLKPNVRLAELKPIAQVAPETIELPVQREADKYVVRLGDLMKDVPRIILANLYIGKLSAGTQVITDLQVRYDDPAIAQTNILSDLVSIAGNVITPYQPALNPEIQQYTLALAKYRQTQLAETKLKQGDRAGAATMLQTAAKTALQMGDKGAATVLQTSATTLQTGEEISEGDMKKTRIASKTVLQ